MVAWLRGVGDVDDGWMGATSLPWEVGVEGDRLVARPPGVLAARRSGRVLEGLLPAVADLEWDARPGDVLVADGRFRLDAGGEVLAVTVGEERHEVPWAGDPLRLVLDGPVLEAFGASGVLAAPVPATGRDGVLTGSTDRVRVHRVAGGAST